MIFMNRQLISFRCVFLNVFLGVSVYEEVRNCLRVSLAGGPRRIYFLLKLKKYKQPK